MPSQHVRRLHKMSGENIIAKFFGFINDHESLNESPLQRYLSRQGRLFLHSVTETVTQAFLGEAPSSYYSPSRSGVNIGVGWAGTNNAMKLGGRHKTQSMAPAFSNLGSIRDPVQPTRIAEHNDSLMLFRCCR